MVIQTNKIGEREFSRNEEVGTYYSVEDILEILDKEKVFFNQSKGGITFSGGEPMLQVEFLLEALKGCKENGYHTAVDTSGYSSVDNYRSIIPFTDLFLFDIKHLDEAKHIESTGVSNTGIIENYRHLLESGKDIMVRIPVIPGFNDDTDYLERLKNFISSTKTASLKRMEGIIPPDEGKMQKIKELFTETGIKVKIGG
jgi:pyruvate formate lyase activating enzyme